MQQHRSVLLATIEGRRSIRNFLSDTVPDATLQHLVRAAGLAPSAHNRQPWRFRLIQDPAEKVTLAEAIGARLRADRLRDGDHSSVIERDVIRSYDRITGSPVVIVVCVTLEEMNIYSDERRAEAEWIMAVQSTAMAGQNLLLAAHAEGLGACWMCAPLFCPDAVRTSLALPNAWQPQGIVLVGYAADGGKPKGRKPLPAILATR